MKINITRKCNACKEAIEINRRNVHDVVYYKKFYYHTDCFRKFAEEKSCLKSSKPAEWKDALDNIEVFEKDALNFLGITTPDPEPELNIKKKKEDNSKRETDDLNEYLLSQYNVAAIPSFFWIAVMGLRNGTYKGRRCKKVPVEILLEAWKWGQKKLNDINNRNKMNHRGPMDDVSRISYDFAIIVKKIPDYLAYKAKQEVLREEANAKNTYINYNNMQRSDTKCDGLDDISALLDEF